MRKRIKSDDFPEHARAWDLFWRDMLEWNLKPDEQAELAELSKSHLPRCCEIPNSVHHGECSAERCVVKRPENVNDLRKKKRT